MIVDSISKSYNLETYNRIKALCNKAKNSGNDTKTMAELLAAMHTEIHNIGLRNFINCLDEIC